MYKPNKRNDWEVLLGCAVIIALVVVLWGLLALILMIAWNSVLPYLVGAPGLAYPQAYALVVIIYLIGGAFRTTVSNEK